MEHVLLFKSSNAHVSPTDVQGVLHPPPISPHFHTKPPSLQAPGKKHKNKKANKKASMMDFD